MIRILAIGKNKDKALQSLQNEYIKRISPFSKIEVIELKDEPNIHIERDTEVRKIKEKEGDRVLNKIKSNEFVILLDLHGKMFSSENFAKQLNNWQSSFSPVTFVIAGSLGPSDALVQRANIRWKLSGLTFTHLMTRILILEQIYRAFMINNHRSYHK